MLRSCIAVVVVTAVLIPGMAAKADTAPKDRPLSESDVVRLAKKYHPTIASQKAQLGLAKAVAFSHGHPTPSVYVERESYPGRQRQDAIGVNVPLQLSGQRSATDAMATSQQKAAAARTTRKQSDTISAVLRRYYDLAALYQRISIEESLVKKLAAARDIAGKRREAGDIAGYDHLRIDVAVELANSRLRQSEQSAITLQHELCRLLRQDPNRTQFAVDLSPNKAVLIRATSDLAATNRKSIRLLQEAVSNAEEARIASYRWWIPDLQLQAALLVGTGMASDTIYGYRAIVGVNIPIFTHVSTKKEKASSHLASRQAQLKEAEVLRETERAIEKRRMIQATNELARFDKAIGDRIERLERAAESGYREGKRSMTVAALIDSKKAWSNVRRQRVRLQLALKRAEVAFRAAEGEFE